jgi:hypothetical protein
MWRVTALGKCTSLLYLLGPALRSIGNADRSLRCLLRCRSKASSAVWQRRGQCRSARAFTVQTECHFLAQADRQRTDITLVRDGVVDERRPQRVTASEAEARMRGAGATFVIVPTDITINGQNEGPRRTNRQSVRGRGNSYGNFTALSFLAPASLFTRGAAGLR